MSFTTKLATGAMLAALGASAVSAQSLVYCSEGSPEGFDPALYTAGTTFDASSHPIYNRLAEFKVGTTEVIPALAESWEVSEDGMKVTFNLNVLHGRWDDFTAAWQCQRHGGPPCPHTG